MMAWIRGTSWMVAGRIISAARAPWVSECDEYMPEVEGALWVVGCLLWVVGCQLIGNLHPTTHTLPTHLKHNLNPHRRIERQGIHPHRRPHVFACFAEQFDQEFAGGVG